MTIVVNDTFTGTAGTALGSHTGETGATWTVGSGFNAGYAPVIDSTGGRLRASVSGGVVYVASGVATTDGEYADAVVDCLSGAGGFGILVRGFASLAGVPRGYMAYFTGTQVKILRLDNSTTFTAVGVQTTTLNLPTSNGNTLRVQATGTGASVQIDVTWNGTNVLSVTDSTASRIATLGSVGVYFDTTFSDSAGSHITSLSLTDSAVANSMTVTAPKDGQICPLSSGLTGTATYAMAGTYTGPAPDQWRLVQDGTNTPLAGFDWTSFSVTPSAGAFSQTISGVPKGGWYNVQVRNSGTPGTIYASGKNGAGVLVGVDGQSQAWLWFSTDARGGDGSLTPNTLVRVTGKQASNAWNVPGSTMNAAIACGNDLVAALGCPVGLIDGSWDGSGLTVTGNGGQWIPTSGTTYQQSISAMNTAGGKLIANVWIQGEADAGQSVSQASYYSGLGTLIAQRRSDLSQSTLPYVLATLARDLTGSQSDAQRENIKLAQVQKCGDANIYRVDRLDLPLSADNIHHNPTGFTALGHRVARAILAAVGQVSQYRGPSITSVGKVNSTTFKVFLTQHNGTDFTPTSSITAFRVTDPGAGNAVITVSAAVRLNATTIQLTLASAPVGLPVVQYLYGSAPSITGVVLDNSPLSLPLEYNSGVTAIVLASAVNLLLTLDGSTPAASLSSLKWAFFDQSTPDGFVAPVAQGSAGSTDGSGNLSLNITGSSLSSGSTGWLTLSNSDGTTTQSPACKSFSGPVQVT